eukprot:TRINITY_DN6591_c0_g1_i1.p1 TRINITY_DN6591_c0_g1~~TRINITY_DN6591_c0_g1_i1.p1  ORF type:complete len:216 (-),score=38.83 TRINITY_DN6591_c0_g1_i1:34-681(-)
MCIRDRFKVLVVGDMGVGKTSIIQRFVNNIFSRDYQSTIGVDFALKVINWDDKTKVRLQLWDIAGQERFGNMTRVYYKEAVAAFVVFDMTRIASFEGVETWKNDIDLKVTLPGGDEPIPVVLLANKCDLLKDNERKKLADRLDDYCKQNNFVGWFETSAKDNLNIIKATKFLVGKVLENTFVEPVQSPKQAETGKLKMQDETPRPKQTGGGCCGN